MPQDPLSSSVCLPGALDLESILRETPRRHVIRERLLEQYGTEAKAVTAITKRPYETILDLDGAGWQSADAVGKAVGIADDAPDRLRAAILEVMRQQETWGHCWHSPQGLLAQTRAMVGIQSRPIMKAIQRGVDKGWIHAEAEDRLYFPKLHGAETRLIDAIARIRAAEIQDKMGLPQEGEEIPGLYQDQTEALWSIGCQPLSIITGPPGSGKTYMLRALLDRFTGNVELMAPTGRAAKRMTESTGRQASTIHRALKPRKINGKFQFCRDEVAPDLLVVDEASMLSLSLAAALLSRVKTGTRVVLIGDPHQLPAVGPGDVLRDLLRSKMIGGADLTEIKRQEDRGIVAACQRILQGGMPDLPRPGEADLAFIRCRSDVETAQAARDLLANHAMRAKYGAEDDYQGIQVITPRRKPGSATSATTFNERLWRASHGRGDHPHPQPGDKVMQTKNSYELGLMNGDIGRVVDVVGHGRARDLTVDFGEDVGEVSARESKFALDFAWATTTHKAQGSEWPVTILMMHESAGGFLLNRCLFYTALSRAQRLCVVVGSESAIRTAVMNDREERRRTGLAERLWRRLCG